MRKLNIDRLLVIHLPTAGGARLSPYLPPPPLFSASLPLVSDRWGWGVAAVPPQPAF